MKGQTASRLTIMDMRILAWRVFVAFVVIRWTYDIVSSLVGWG